MSEEGGFLARVGPEVRFDINNKCGGDGGEQIGLRPSY